MKFTDLDFDSLEYVLEHLELTDLLNVADSCKRLRKAAELVYTREYGGKEVIFNRPKDMSPKQSFEITNDRIAIKGLKNSLQLLRCVGHIIREIFLCKPKERPIIIYRRIITYINSYCAEYLKVFMIVGNSTDPVSKDFEIPFPNVVHTQFLSYYFNEKCYIRRFFPNLRVLECINMDNASFFSFNTHHFPYLESLYIRENGCIEKEMILAFLRLNPQLKSLILETFSEPTSSTLNIDLIRDAVVNLQNIEMIGISLHPSNNLGYNLIHMKNVKRFNISFFVLHTNEISESSFPFSFEKLERFCIAFFGLFIDNSRVPFETQIFDFIDRHPKITHITFIGVKVDWSKLAKCSPSLHEIEFTSVLLSIGDVIVAMPKFQMLKKVKFEASRVDYEKFRTQLDSKWKMKIKPPGYSSHGDVYLEWKS